MTSSTEQARQDEHDIWKKEMPKHDKEIVEQALKDHLRIGSPEMELLIKANQDEAVERAMGELRQELKRHNQLYTENFFGSDSTIANVRAKYTEELIRAIDARWPNAKKVKP